MGWKNVKEHYRIKHAVQVTKDGICIGSPYIHNIIVVSLDGAVTREYRGASNDDLMRYQKEFHDDPETLKRLVQEPDTFETSIPAYTYRGGEIIEKQCEVLGWPNVTHDGEMMHDNTHSPVKAQVVKWAKENAALRYEWATKRVAEAQQKLAECQGEVTLAEHYLVKLEEDYPDTPAAKG